ncbi:hypothetical protein VNO77_18183 [Canavalia gladiata]|uniref:Uncharacterized protein n=1 Tax=Canavalia gladiata TaxID=3824 RepID=A0AAN9LL22_CANGL
MVGFVEGPSLHSEHLSVCGGGVMVHAEAHPTILNPHMPHVSYHIISNVPVVSHSHVKLALDSRASVYSLSVLFVFMNIATLKFLDDGDRFTTRQEPPNTTHRK